MSVTLTSVNEPVSAVTVVSVVFPPTVKSPYKVELSLTTSVSTVFTPSTV